MTTNGVQILQVHETYNIRLDDEDDDERISPTYDDPIEQHRNGATHPVELHVEHTAHHYENVNGNKQHATSSTRRWFDADVIDEYVNHEGMLFVYILLSNLLIIIYV